MSEPLTPQQDAIMRLVARGLVNKEIAAELGIEQRTVQNHLYLAYQKIGATNRLEAAVKGGYLVPKEDLR